MKNHREKNFTSRIRLRPQLGPLLPDYSGIINLKMFDYSSVYLSVRQHSHPHYQPELFVCSVMRTLTDRRMDATKCIISLLG